jgi:hypothetical protein
MCETINKYSNGLLELNFREDVTNELIEAQRALNSGTEPAIGLGFQFWIRHQPSFLALLTPEFLAEVWDDFRRTDNASSVIGIHLFDDDVPEYRLKPEDFLRAPVIDDDNRNNAFFRLYPLIFRAYGQPERYRSPLATWGIEFSVTGWMQLMDGQFRWLEHEAVQLKSHGFPDDQIPLIVQVKEKFGGLCVYTHHVPSMLQDDFRARYEALSEAAGQTCVMCGDPGTERCDGWIRVMCDRCEEKHQGGQE